MFDVHGYTVMNDKLYIPRVYFGDLRMVVYDIKTESATYETITNWSDSNSHLIGSTNNGKLVFAQFKYNTTTKASTLQITLYDINGDRSLVIKNYPQFGLGDSYQSGGVTIDTSNNILYIAQCKSLTNGSKIYFGSRDLNDTTSAWVDICQSNYGVYELNQGLKIDTLIYSSTDNSLYYYCHFADNTERTQFAQVRLDKKSASTLGVVDYFNSQITRRPIVIIDGEDTYMCTGSGFAGGKMLYAMLKNKKQYNGIYDIIGTNGNMYLYQLDNYKCLVQYNGFDNKAYKGFNIVFCLGSFLLSTEPICYRTIIDKDNCVLNCFDTIKDASILCIDSETGSFKFELPAYNYVTNVGYNNPSILYKATSPAMVYSKNTGITISM